VSIRLRLFEGRLIALCGAETDEKPGDVYLDDWAHMALAAKFARDWRGQVVDWDYPEDDRLAATQKLRDAESTLLLWLAHDPHRASG
jgi:hypothetical protein